MQKALPVHAGWLTALLLAAMIVVAAWGVQAAGWEPGLWPLWLIGALGVLTGRALARSRFPGWLASGFTLVYALFCAGFFIAAFALEGTAHDRAVEVLVRLNDFLYHALYGGVSRDTLPFVFILSLLFWLLGTGAAWAVFRRDSGWGAIIPAGLALFINTYYYYGPRSLDEYFITYLVLALLLLTRMSLLAREREWRTARVQYNPDMRFEFLRAGLVVALGGVLVAWAGPSLAASPAATAAWEDVTRPWKYVREGWTRLFSAVRSYGQSAADFYGDSLILTGAARLTNARIMDVHLGVPGEEIDPDQERQAAAPEGRFYWRALSFDTYQDGQWLVTDVEAINHLPDRQRWSLPPYLLREEVWLTFTSYVPMLRLYTMAQPQWVDRRAVFNVVVLPGNTIDAAGVVADKPVRSGETYQARGSVSRADMASLRRAGTDYPAWVTARYLQVPRTITARTRLLAETIVADAGATNPFDQAQAVTDWLRQHITYDDTIGAPPRQVEPVEFALFYSLRGFCNYYASAEVMLLRQLGIPARLAVGFAQGSFASAGYFQVLENDAHAWPEVFFPNYGWVEFEPTTAQAPLIRPERQAASADPDLGPTPAAGADDADQPPTPDPDRPNPEEPGQADARSPWLDGATWTLVLALLAAATLAGGALAVGLMLRAQLIGLDNFGPAGQWLLRARGRELPSLIALAYLNLERAAHWLGLPLPPALTPHERAGLLGAELPSARPQVQTITDQYVAERYGAERVDPGASQSAWRGLWPRVWRRGVINYFHRVMERGQRRFETYWQDRRRRKP